MKKLDVSAITDSSQFPVKQGTLQFLQDANAEVLAQILIGLVGPLYNPATVYVLTGCINTGSGAVFNISAGAVFYQGEVFLVDAANFTTTGSNVPVFSIVITQYTTNADPVTFTDSVVRNVHNIRKIAIVQGASGSGIANYMQGYFLNFTIPPQLNLALSGAGGNVLQIGGVYPNLTLFVPTPPTSTNPILFAGSYNVGDVPSGPGADFNITFAAVSTAAYYVMGCLISNGTPSSDSGLTWTIRNRTTTGFILHLKEYDGQTQNVAFEYMLFAK